MARRPSLRRKMPAGFYCCWSGTVDWRDAGGDWGLGMHAWGVCLNLFGATMNLFGAAMNLFFFQMVPPPSMNHTSFYTIKTYDKTW